MSSGKTGSHSPLTSHATPQNTPESQNDSTLGRLAGRPGISVVLRPGEIIYLLSYYGPYYMAAVKNTATGHRKLKNTGTPW